MSDSEYRPAGHMFRFIALFIDSFFIMTVYALIFAPLSYVFLGSAWDIQPMFKAVYDDPRKMAVPLMIMMFSTSVFYFLYNKKRGRMRCKNLIRLTNWLTLYDQ